MKHFRSHPSKTESKRAEIWKMRNFNFVCCVYLRSCLWKIIVYWKAIFYLIFEFKQSIKFSQRTCFLVVQSDTKQCETFRLFDLWLTSAGEVQGWCHRCWVENNTEVVLLNRNWVCLTVEHVAKYTNCKKQLVWIRNLSAKAFSFFF